MTKSRWIARKRSSSPTLAALGLVLACGSGESGSGVMSGKQPPTVAPTPARPDPSMPLPTQPGPLTPLTPPQPGEARLPAAVSGNGATLARFDALKADVARLRGLNAAQLLAEYPLQQVAELGYTPSRAAFMDRIQASALSLDTGELAALDQNGFVISSRQQFPTFLRGYAAIYMEHLPVYVSADALLEAVHSSYDTILAALESAILAPQLKELLALMLAGLDEIDASAATRDDLRLYLQVAAGLLDESSTGASAEARSLIAQARAAQGIATRSLFGVDRMFDFSQFTPRGHYTEELKNYFQAMIWRAVPIFA